MAILIPIGVDQTTGQSRTLKDGETLEIVGGLEVGTSIIGATEATTFSVLGTTATTPATAGAGLTLGGGDGLTTGAGGIVNLVAGSSPSGTEGVVQVNSLPLPTVLSQTTGVNLDTISTDPLYTVPAGRSAIITSIMVRLTTATAPAGDAVVSAGVGGAFDNIIASTTLTGLNATTETFVLVTGGIIHTAAAGEVITFNITTADTGGATTTATVELIGYLL